MFKFSNGIFVLVANLHNLDPVSVKLNTWKTEKKIM